MVRRVNYIIFATSTIEPLIGGLIHKPASAIPMTIIATIEPLIGGLIQEENRHYLANSPAIEPLIGGLIR